MAQIPTTALTATNRAPKRSSTIERPLSGSNAVVCTTATSPVWSTWAAIINPLAQAAMVRATEMCILILSGAIAPTAEADSPTSAVTTSKADVTYRPGPAER